MLHALLLTSALLFQQAGPASPNGAINVHISYADGTAFLEGLAIARAVSESGKPMGDTRTFRRPDKPGDFLFSNLAPGRYVVCIVPEPSVCFPDAATPGGPAFITVAANAIENLNFVLPAAMNGFHISGRVIRPANQTVGQMEVTAVRDSDYNYVETALDGSFEFLHMPAGTYTFTVEPLGAASVTAVVDRDIPNLELTIPQLVEIRGTATVEGRTDVSGVFDIRRQTAFILNFTGPDPASAQVLPNGAFLVRLAVGEYRVVADRLPAGYYLKSLSSGDTDLIANRLQVVASDKPLPISLTLAVSSGVSVSGNVTGLLNANAPARVVLSGTATSSVFESEVHSDGSFAIPKVLPGTYAARVDTSSGIASPPVPVMVPNKNISDLVIPVPPPTTVSGRVFVDGNGPPPKFVLLLLRGTIANWNPLLDNTAAAKLQMDARSGAYPVIQIAVDALPDGSFKFELPTGDYRVAATRAGIHAPYFLRSISYSGVDLSKEPMHVTDTEASELLVGFATTSRNPWSRVSGKVTGFEPNLGPFRVALEGENTSTIEAQVNPDGTFEFDHVLQNARYIAKLRPENKAATTPRISMAEKDVSNIEIEVPHEMEIRGRVTVDGRGPVPSFNLSLARSMNTVTVLVKPDASGAFQIRLPDDERQVAIDALPFGYTLKALSYGPMDLRACVRGTPPRCAHPPLKIGDSGAMSLLITFALDPAIPFAKLSGKVSGLDPEQSGLRLVLSDPTTYSTFEERLDSDGTFAFSSLPQGAYVPMIAGFSGGAQSVTLRPSLVTIHGLDRSGFDLAVSKVSAKREEPVQVESSAGARVTDFAGGSRASAEEAATVATLRTIVTAEVTMLAVSQGNFASLDQMITEGLLPDNFRDPVNGFRLGVISVGSEFVVAAVPDSSGSRIAFYVTPDGAVRYSTIESLAPAGKSGSPVSQ